MTAQSQHLIRTVLIQHYQRYFRELRLTKRNVLAGDGGAEHADIISRVIFLATQTKRRRKQLLLSPDISLGISRSIFRAAAIWYHLTVIIWVKIGIFCF